MMKHMPIVVLLVLLQAIFTYSFFADRCHDYCGLNSGKCLSNGRCLCVFGWTGPNAAYITSGPREGMIVADFCSKLCQYNFLFHNPACVSPSTTITPPTTHPMFSNQAVSCDKSCGKFESAGHCLNNNKCLCWWGWTGNHAMYVNNGPYKNRIVADDCMISCHYTHDFRNPDCIKDDQDETTPAEDMDPESSPPSVTSSPSSNAISTSDIITNATPDADTLTITSEIPPSPSTPGDNLTQGPQAACDPKCERFGQGKCLSDGSCLCWWGWTGPNATYITTGNLTNRIKADYCTEPCHYTHDYMNTSCATIPTPKTCDIPSNSTPQLPCLPRCGAGVFHGECLRNGRCLCWWGWTGPHSCFVDGGDYNNRIIADYCEEPCHYTHDFRNNSCVKSEDIPLASQGPSTSLFPTSVSTSSAAVQSISKTEQPTSTGDTTTTADFSTSQHLWTTDEYITLEELSTTEQPIATEGLPTTAEEQPMKTEEQLTTAEEQPITTEEQISMTKEQPTATEPQPTTTGEQPESTEQTPPIEPHDFTESTEPVNLVEPSGTQSAEVKKSTEAAELLGTTVPTEGRELTGFMEPTEATEPTEETTHTKPPEPKETNRPTEFAEYPEATELTRATEPSELKGTLKPTEEETTDWQEWLAATEVMIDPTLATGPTEFKELSEAAKTEVTEPTEAVEPTEIRSTKQAETTESAERTDATEPLESGPIQPNEPMELNHEPEETNQVAEGPPSSMEQFPAVSSKNHSSAASLSIYMVAVGIMAIIFAMIGLVAMMKHHGKCFKRHLGYRQLGDNTYFVNENEMSDELSKVI